MYILGIWDGHDSGAALIEDNKIIAAVNEERLTRRKLEIEFPYLSILKCLEIAEIEGKDIKEVSYSTTDITKTLSRYYPKLKRDYYKVRRKKTRPSRYSFLIKKLKYLITLIPGNRLTRALNDLYIKRSLKKIGITDVEIKNYDHHYCHIMTAIKMSPFQDGLALSLDGLGDGKSSLLYEFKEQEINYLSEIDSENSLGVFFEHITNLLNMRELEDEGKVMALANFAFPIADNKNVILDLFERGEDGFQIKYSPLNLYKKLKEILWAYPNEQFAYMAQRTLEILVTQYIAKAMTKYKQKNLAVAGGVFANIKLNRLIKNLPEVESFYVYPHMGDGGLALGAALASTKKHKILYQNLYWGQKFSNEQIKSELEKTNLKYEYIEDVVDKTVELLADKKIVFWFQGEMEYGPRALGHRSIIALPTDEDLKDDLNLKLKQRVWYQPFCPSMLECEAKELFEDFDDNEGQYMTLGYMVKKEKRKEIKAVVHIDGSCRPQILKDEGDDIYLKLLRKIKEETGLGALLNTSYNLHGEPLVCTPKDAINTFINSGNENLMIGDFHVQGKRDE